MIKMAPSTPALPTTQARRRYMMTPRMVRTVGAKTPAKVPNFRSSGEADSAPPASMCRRRCRRLRVKLRPR
jgi:hypothetical protein